MKRSLILTVLVGLACGGLGGGDPGATDPAQLLIDARDYPGAEKNLRARLEADPKDALAWRLHGDVSFVRGKDFRQRWKENLVKATDSYAEAVRADPARCRAWNRLATVVQARAAQDETRVPGEVLDALPWDQGWSACPGAALLALAENRLPTEAELDAAYAKAGKGASAYDVVRFAQPERIRAHEVLDYTGLSWKPAFERPEPVAGGAFAVLETPVTAVGIAGSKTRSFSYAEDITIQSISGGKIVYGDRRFPGTRPDKGVTLATACPGTTWAIEGPDNYPMGTCTKGSQTQRKSGVYDLNKLEMAGPAHWEYSTFPKARISWDVIAEGSVVCTGGRVGRLYQETPTCKVDFERAIPQQRTIPVDAGLAALDRAHAEKMVHAKRSSTVFGDALATHLAAGEVAVGLPYGLVGYSLPALTGCQGRALYTKAEIVDGGITFTCEIDGYNYVFVDLELASVSAR